MSPGLKTRPTHRGCVSTLSPGLKTRPMRIPGALPVAGAAMILIAAAILALLMPAARASRVNVIQALRSE